MQMAIFVSGILLLVIGLVVFVAALASRSYARVALIPASAAKVGRMARLHGTVVALAPSPLVSLLEGTPVVATYFAGLKFMGKRSHRLEHCDNAPFAVRDGSGVDVFVPEKSNVHPFLPNRRFSIQEGQARQRIEQHFGAMPGLHIRAWEATLTEGTTGTILGRVSAVGGSAYRDRPVITLASTKWRPISFWAEGQEPTDGAIQKVLIASLIMLGLAVTMIVYGYTPH
ncbi:MAG: hypothetical protein KC416_02320 [Myxococcales bacterium]|nr:hypothetical protein [Myxococcales bacterium]